MNRLCSQPLNEFLQSKHHQKCLLKMNFKVSLICNSSSTLTSGSDRKLKGQTLFWYYLNIIFFFCRIKEGTYQQRQICK